jgi:hypothetical protein
MRKRKLAERLVTQRLYESDANRNLKQLTDAAELLRPLLEDLVFVGGCATAVLITDQAAAEIRPTLDVDAIAEITAYADYVMFSERGFAPSDSPRTPVKVRHSVAASKPQPRWTSCHSTRRFSRILEPVAQTSHGIFRTANIEAWPLHPRRNRTLFLR